MFIYIQGNMTQYVLEKLVDFWIIPRTLWTHLNIGHILSEDMHQNLGAGKYD